MIKNSGKMLLALASVAVVAGCASPVKLDKPVEVEKKDVTSQTTTTTETPKSSVATTDQSTKPVVPITLDRVIYFDFDSYVVKDEFRPIVDAHANLLKANPSAKEVAEGHTDERGGSEYNLALGQRRAQSVKTALGLLGVKDAQVEPVSYGKENPRPRGTTRPRGNRTVGPTSCTRPGRSSVCRSACGAPADFGSAGFISASDAFRGVRFFGASPSRLAGGTRNG